MSGAYRLSNGIFVLALGVGALALVACSPEAAKPGHQVTGSSSAGSGSAGSVSPNPDLTGAAGDVGTMTSGTAGSGIVIPPATGMGGSGAIPDDPSKIGAPPIATCGAALPANFVTICSGCHTVNGAPNSRYPDLFAFKGTAADMKTKVRMGGNGMAAYPATLVSDADLDLVFKFFTTSKRTGLDAISLGDVKPLFTAADVVNPPIVFKRDDGALITRGAGRVRGRHEGPLDTNVPFMEFVADYFLSRTYGFIVEDFTPMGQAHVRVTYLPISMPTGGTNFRAWKNYGNGDVFTNNGGMQSDVSMPSIMVGGQEMTANYPTKFAPFARIQQAETTMNGRTKAPVKAGDLFEFEFGIFNDGGAIQPPGSRTNYYTDTFRYQVGKGGVTSNNPDAYTGGKGILGPVPLAQLGGDTTNVWPYYMQETQFGQMALNVQHENVQHLVMGRRLFHTDFATGAHSEANNPVFMEQVGKAGPMGQSTSCETCHASNGPGVTLGATGLDAKSSMSIKLYNAGALGVQLQPQEGNAAVMATTMKTVALADGTSVTLHKPTIAIMTKDGTSPAFSARIARKVIGMGLLEAIDERTILSRADQKDCDGNGISGRPNFVKDPTTGALRLGRFGWKAEKISIQHQIAEALSEDMGVGTTMFPEAGKAELNDDDLSHLTTYMRLVSVPGQRNYGDPQVAAGEQIFKTIGCASCHATDVVTGANHPFAELRNQAIKPFTDLLLHDMGADLADNSGIAASDSESAPASALEWRTPPLWGTGLLATVNMHTGLLHDGRAANVLEAILWHGGEAETTKVAVTKLSATDRAALLAFVSSL
jgi:CxxC motif-containing protein (DUF1111 family)/cytochrome c553